jgi:hypothetical protein
VLAIFRPKATRAMKVGAKPDSKEMCESDCSNSHGLGLNAAAYFPGVP